jgi:Na+-driven multidrug efflux pump
MSDVAIQVTDKKFEMMTTAPVERLVVRQAIPAVIIMMVSAMYNMADTYFVSSLGTSAVAAVGVSFALMNVIQAVGFFFGHGSGNFIPLLFLLVPSLGVLGIQICTPIADTLTFRLALPLGTHALRQDLG